MFHSLDSFLSKDVGDLAPNCLTDEVVQNVLRNDKGAEAVLDSWSLEEITSKFDGFTSVIKNARVKYSSNGQLEEVCYVVKANTGKGEETDYFYGLIFAKEANFYSDVIPSMNKVLEEIGLSPLSFPKCYYSRIEKGNDLIILENLREQGYQMRSKAHGVDAAHASLVLKELAKLHAASVLFQKRNPEVDMIERFDCLKKEWTKEFNLGLDFGGLVNYLLDISLAMFEKFGDCGNIIKWIEQMKPDVWKTYDKQLIRTPPFATIIHGDCWINNLLFRYDASNAPIEVKFLDLQGCRKASVALDLQHFLNLNVTDGERRANLSTLMGTYHQAFNDIMEAGGSRVPFTFEELRQEYIDKGFYGVLYSIMWLPNMVRMPEDDTDILDTGSASQRSQKDNVLAMVDKNPFLKPRIMSVMEEWKEHGLIKD